MSGGSTPVPSMSQGVNLAAAQSAGNFGSSSNINNLGISGMLASCVSFIRLTDFVTSVRMDKRAYVSKKY